MNWPLCLILLGWDVIDNAILESWSIMSISMFIIVSFHLLLSLYASPDTSWSTGSWRWPPWRTSPAWLFMWLWAVWTATWLGAPSQRLVSSYWELLVWLFVPGEDAHSHFLWFACFWSWKYFLISDVFEEETHDNSFVSSYISKEILTIREAVWLTDNTYKYEDLVRMMGEVVSVLEGKIRVRVSAILV